MIGALLYFVLGFAAAALLAILLAPIAVRRAVTLTRRQVEAKLPLSIDEIRAEKDKVRAELAMTIRRLEMDRDTANRARVRHEVQAHQAEEQRREALQTLDGVKGKLSEKEKEYSDVSALFKKAEEGLDARDQELKERGDAIDTLNRDLAVALKVGEEQKMEIAATMMAREELQSALNIVEGGKKAKDADLRDLRAKLKVAQTDLRQATRDKTDAEKRLARMEKRAEMLEEKLLSRKVSSPTRGRKAQANDRIAAVDAPQATQYAVSKAETGAPINPKKNSLLQQSTSEKKVVAKKVVTTMPKAAPLEIKPIDADTAKAAPVDAMTDFDTLKGELEAIGEGKAFDRAALEARLQAVAANMSVQASQEEGMADVIAGFEKQAEKAPQDSLARIIVDARLKN